MKVVYIRNLSQDSTEAKIKEDFGQYGEVEKAKKMKDYCFVHFKDRDSAVKVNAKSWPFIPRFDLKEQKKKMIFEAKYVWQCAVIQQDRGIF